ncbi:MAG: hypothetical protein K8S54_06265 [Spirochaetia bacterium]|nr:hypothetical protein [Spirochaetia bacterium]
MNLVKIQSILFAGLFVVSWVIVPLADAQSIQTFRNPGAMESYLKSFGNNPKKAAKQGRVMTPGELQKARLPFRVGVRMLGSAKTKSGYDLTAFFVNDANRPAIKLALLKGGKYTIRPEGMESMGMGQGMIDVVAEDTQVFQITEKGKLTIKFGTSDSPIEYEQMEDYFHPK